MLTSSNDETFAATPPTTLVGRDDPNSELVTPKNTQPTADCFGRAHRPPEATADLGRCAFHHKLVFVPANGLRWWQLRRPHWLRPTWSLRSLLVLSLAAGILGGEIARRWDYQWRVHYLEEAGGFVVCHPWWSLSKATPIRISLNVRNRHALDQLHQCLDVAAGLPEVKRLELTGRGVNKQTLEKIQHFPELEELVLARSDVVDQDLLSLHKLSQLQSLDLSHSRISGEGLHVLQGLPALERLSLEGTSVADEHLAHLLLAPRLRTIQLGATEVRGKTLAQLAGLPRLESIRLAGTSVRGPQLRALTACQNLQKLDLAGTPLSDRDLKHVLKLYTLKHLCVARTRVTHRGLIRLRGLHHLQSLEIDARFGPQRVDWLRAKLPGVDILVQ